MKITEMQKKTIELLNPWWAGVEIELGISRTVYLAKIKDWLENQRPILLIVGSRRVGKTRILLQTIYGLIKRGAPPQKILFLSLDNSNLEAMDWYSYIVDSGCDYVFLDEVHYAPKWAQTLKSLYDLPVRKFRLVCSGSSSKAIEESQAFLTGRSSRLAVTPLDFAEFSRFSPGGKPLQNYLFYGGYPEFVLDREPNYLNGLVKDVIEKDIIRCHRINNSQYLLDICQILAKQVGFKGSANKIAKTLKLDNKTAENYLRYLKEVRLIEAVYQYSPSQNQRLYAPKKYYFSDLGVRNSFVGFSDLGALAENAVFLRLAKMYGAKNVFYLSDSRGNEVDFVVTLPGDEVLLVESKYNNLQSAVINSLAKIFFKEIYNKKMVKRIVVTDGIDDTIKKDGQKITLISLEKFLIK